MVLFWTAVPFVGAWGGDCDFADKSAGELDSLGASKELNEQCSSQVLKSNCSDVSNYAKKSADELGAKDAGACVAMMNNYSNYSGKPGSQKGEYQSCIKDSSSASTYLSELDGKLKSVIDDLNERSNTIQNSASGCGQDTSCVTQSNNAVARIGKSISVIGSDRIAAFETRTKIDKLNAQCVALLNNGSTPDPDKPGGGMGLESLAGLAPMLMQQQQKQPTSQEPKAISESKKPDFAKVNSSASAQPMPGTEEVVPLEQTAESGNAQSSSSYGGNVSARDGGSSPSTNGTPTKMASAKAAGESGTGGASLAPSTSKNKPEAASPGTQQLNAGLEYGGGGAGTSIGSPGSRKSSLGLTPDSDLLSKMMGEKDKPGASRGLASGNNEADPGKAKALGANKEVDKNLSLFMSVGEKIREYKHIKHLLL